MKGIVVLEDGGVQVNAGTGPSSLPGHRQERISSESQFCFICGFVMIMIAIVIFYFYFLVCEQLKEAEEDGLSGAESGEIVTGLHISFLKSEGAFQHFRPEKRNLRNKSLAHPQMVSQLKRLPGECSDSASEP